MHNTYGSVSALQNKLTCTSRYEIIEDFRNISQSLEREQKLKQFNSREVASIKQRLSALQFKKKRNQHQSTQLQRKLTRLIDTQNFATFLQQLKCSVNLKKHNQLEDNRTKFNSLRQSMKKDKEKSVTIHNKIKNGQINKFKQQHEAIMEIAKKRSQQSSKQIKQQKETVKAQQIKIRERLKKYQKYKLDRSNYNYWAKVHQQHQKHQDRKILLEKLKKEQKKEEAKRIKITPKIIDMLYLTKIEQS